MAKHATEATGNIITALDLGTTRTCALIAEENPEGGLNVIGVGNAPSWGLRKGVVVNIEGTVESINKAMGEAQRMAGVHPESVFVSVGGDHIKGLSSHGVIGVSRKDKEIIQEDVDRVIEAAKAVSIPQDREIIHVLTQEYLIDNQDGIRDPVGMSGVRLEAIVHMITGSVTSVQNIIKSVERSNLNVEDMVLQPLASAEAVLTRDERELGVALVDIGGGTTDLMVFLEGAVRYTAVIPVGGNQLTRDLAIGLRTPNEEAESIKRKHGCVVASMVDDDEQIAVPGVGGRPPRPVPARNMVEILQPRMEEILGLVDVEMKKSGFDGKLAAGMVVTGGSAQIKGMLPLCEDLLRQQVRLGKPSPLAGLGDVVQSPEYSAAVGLLLHGNRIRRDGGVMGNMAGGEGLLDKFKKWFKDYI